MRVIVEASAFLAIAAVAHLALWSPEKDSGDQGAGSGGESLLTIQPSSANIQRMVETWDKPPEATELVQTAMQAPDMPEQAAPALETPQDAPPNIAALIKLPDMAQRPDAPPLPVINPSPPETMPDPKPEKVETAKPKPKPETKPRQTASEESAPVAAQRAKGTGSGVAQGENKTAKTATLSAAKKTSLLSRWGGQIRAKIARRTPRGAGRGTAIVTIRVSGNGVLLGVSLAKSSGNPRLDKIALTAVQQAGRFPSAPASLNVSSQTFRLPIKSR